jgi:hypothetical protein
MFRTEEQYKKELFKLNLVGRDEFYTHLIIQEYPLWVNQIIRGESIQKSEVDFLIKRRGFNKQEATNLRSLAKFLNTNSDSIIKFTTNHNNMKTPDAIKHLQKELKKDKGYRETWVANIAMPFYDEFNRWKKKNPGKHPNSQDIHKIGNKAAEDFLKILCDQIEYPSGR